MKDTLLLEPTSQIVTLVDLLNYRAIHQPNKLAYSFLVDGEKEEFTLTYQELHQKAQAIAALLQSMNATGERALLLYQPGLDFIVAFFGCLYAKVIAVPVYPPRRNQRLSRLKAIGLDAQAKFALTTTSVLTHIKQSFSQEAELSSLHCIATDNLINYLDEDWQKPLLFEDTLAFLQYTSGSTGMPKGVMVSHSNVLHNEEMIKRGFQHTEKSIVVGWLPLFHDMGLIGNVLQPLYAGIPSYILSPLEFLQKPLCWLKAISRYKATTSGGPNFAYDMCIRKIMPEQRTSLDLSSWEVAFNGAEPIHAETLENFANAFATCGFRRQAFYPCYGMAETTLFVSGGSKIDPPIVYELEKSSLEQNQVVITNREYQETKKIVCCGQAWLDEKIVIVNPESLARCSDDQVGEIWVSSKSVAQGYWNQKLETEYTFNAFLADTGEGPFVRTGDLGFLKDKELFVTGRLKDVIIIRGRNHYPQDIELTVEQSHPALKPACGAAFAIDFEGEERLIITQELERSYLRKLNTDEVITKICQIVAKHHEIQVSAILLLKPGSIPKTSSGKIQRHACKSNILNNSLDIVALWAIKPTIKSLLKTPDCQEESIKEQLSFENSQNLLVEKNDFQLINLATALQNAEKLQDWLVSKIQKYLKANSYVINAQEIDISKPLIDYGLDSLTLIDIASELQNWLNFHIDPNTLYDLPSIKSIAQHLESAQIEQINTKIEKMSDFEVELLLQNILK